MKKILLVLVALFLTVSQVHAITWANKVSGSSVSFNSVTPKVVTFNSVTKHIWLQNESVADCYVDIKCGNNGSLIPSQTVVKLPAIGNATPNTVEFDFATRNLGFLSKQGSGTITYVVYGESGDL